MKTFGEKVMDFNSGLRFNSKVPEDIQVMNPYLNKEVIEMNRRFYEKYYNDKRKRRILLGINPGRYGGGITGISFTDPVRLQNVCGIDNNFQKRPELSSEFIYLVIDSFGGSTQFFEIFFLSALCPLGFIKDGKNYNYYDNKILLSAAEPFIESTIKSQVDFGIDRSVAFCLGEGKNYKFLDLLNKRLELFDTIIRLPHPRFIMQYRRKKLEDYIKLYLNVLRG